MINLETQEQEEFAHTRQSSSLVPFPQPPPTISYFILIPRRDKTWKRLLYYRLPHQVRSDCSFLFRIRYRYDPQIWSVNSFVNNTQIIYFDFVFVFIDFNYCKKRFPFPFDLLWFVSGGCAISFVCSALRRFFYFLLCFSFSHTLSCESFRLFCFNSIAFKFLCRGLISFPFPFFFLHFTLTFSLLLFIFAVALLLLLLLSSILITGSCLLRLLQCQCQSERRQRERKRERGECVCERARAYAD